MFCHKAAQPYLLPDGTLDMEHEDVQRTLGRFSDMLGRFSFMLQCDVKTPEDVVAHGVLFEEQERDAARVQSARGTGAPPAADKVQPSTGNPEAEYAAYVRACQQRKQAIEEARVAWKKAVQDAERARAAWADYVRTMRARYEEVKSSPVPVRVV